MGDLTWGSMGCLALGSMGGFNMGVYGGFNMGVYRSFKHMVLWDALTRWVHWDVKIYRLYERFSMRVFGMFSICV